MNTSIESLSLFVAMPVVFSALWVLVWFIQTPILAMLDARESALPKYLEWLFFIPLVTLAVMQTRRTYGKWSYLTWGIQAVALFWIFFLRLALFAFGVVAYIFFAVSRRLMNLRSDLFSSGMFALVQMEAGWIDSSEIAAREAEYQEQLTVAYTEMAMSQERAESLARNLQIQQAVASMARQYGWSADEVWHSVSQISGAPVPAYSQQAQFPNMVTTDVHGLPLPPMPPMPQASGQWTNPHNIFQNARQETVQWSSDEVNAFAQTVAR